jgi:glycine cleavage system H protein
MGKRFYTDTHEWLEIDGDQATVGISRFAQQELGDIVYVGFPNRGSRIGRDEELCVLESLKAAADVYAPVDLTVLDVNPLLVSDPNSINSDPEGSGWLIKGQLEKPLDEERLLAPAVYASLVG